MMVDQVEIDIQINFLLIARLHKAAAENKRIKQITFCQVKFHSENASCCVLLTSAILPIVIQKYEKRRIFIKQITTGETCVPKLLLLLLKSIQ